MRSLDEQLTDDAIMQDVREIEQAQIDHLLSLRDLSDRGYVIFDDTLADDQSLVYVASAWSFALPSERITSLTSWADSFAVEAVSAVH